ncbi:ABC-type uncharacterized transport systems, ATPase components [Longilinea arvoryzae]|uniref:ABC-type uncharacterized transport systems, ATPase components n=1 Tax=Longilinea arvoryzae TaxID=360412 RepID=A0A0S7BBF9_9CHLR|nr:ABC transporter ATP-binding protein [Longilinea arvoryzae]GAP14958.1 ABC-type uncharacterized transport systems, ATPase components [Longilinea arvoryzae]
MEYLTLAEISKIYSNGVIANDHVNFGLRKGEIHAIIGENGAGKSTLMKVLYGLEKRDGGEIYLNGEKVNITSPLDALGLSIGMVPQHSMLIHEMTVSENIFLGIEKKRRGLLDKNKMDQETRSLCEKYNMVVDPKALCGSLSLSATQKVGILKALVRGANILILDEPTAVLAPQETRELFAQLKLLKLNGYSIIIITHKLKEITQLCDRVTIMRAGRDCGVFAVDQISEEEISRRMVGNDVKLTVEKTPAKPGDSVIKAANLTVTRKNRTCAVDHISFSVRKGEILCFAGVEGNGQRETVRCLTGLEKKYTGQITLLDQDLKEMNVREIREKGLSHIPEDRQRTGSNLAASILDNLVAISVAKESKCGVIRYRKLKANAQKLISRYAIKAKSISQPMNSLSGGNMQKVIIAREIDAGSEVLVADQPTRGVDVGAMEFIHKKLVGLRDSGKAILLVSADLSEVINLADRILVFHNGKITAQITDVPHVTEEQLGRYMLGIDRMPDLEGA